MAINRIFNATNIRLPGNWGGNKLPPTLEYKFITTMEKLLRRSFLTDDQHLWPGHCFQRTVDVFNNPPPPAA